MCSCPWKHSSNGWFMRTELRIVYVRSISNLLNSRKTTCSFMPCFSTNKQSCTASDRNHAHLIRLQSTTHGEASWPPLLSIGNRAWIRLKLIVAAATIQIMKVAWVTYLGALSRLNALLIPQISAHPQSRPQCKVHRPWALFHEGTVLWYNQWAHPNDVVWKPAYHIRSIRHRS